MLVYMCITTGELELPIVVRDTVKELAEAVGMKKSYISNCIAKGTITKGYDPKGNKFIRVNIEEETGAK